jgi:hypothetical protein
MHFNDLEGNVVGTCLPLPFNQEIEIDRDWWERNPSKFVREQLIFHELGHCILMRPHTEYSDEGIISWMEKILYQLGLIEYLGYLEDGCPSSTMHPYIIPDVCIHRHREHYIKELFSQRKFMYDFVDN